MFLFNIEAIVIELFDSFLIEFEIHWYSLACYVIHREEKRVLYSRILWFHDASEDFLEVWVNLLLSDVCLPQFLDHIEIIRSHLDIIINEISIHLHRRGSASATPHAMTILS